MGLQSFHRVQEHITPALQRRFLVLYLPHWATDYLKRADPSLQGKPLALYERIKGGLRLAALDPDVMREGLRIGQNLADARALWPSLVVREIDRSMLRNAFESFADWHSNSSPLVSVLGEGDAYGDLVLDITGVSHLFGGEEQMLQTLLNRLRQLGYSIAGAIAPTIGAAWAVSHFSRIQIVHPPELRETLEALPVAALRLTEAQVAAFGQMGLSTIGAVRQRSRKQLQARFGARLLLRIDQAFGLIEERMTPRLPAVEHHVDRRLADPISLMDDVLLLTHDLAVQLGCRLEAEGLGAQAFHLFLYRVDHKVMTLSLNSARLTRDPHHISDLFRHRAARLEGEYDAGFGIDMVRLAAGSVERLDPMQEGVFTVDNGLEDIDRLNDRLSSRLGHTAVLQTELIASRLPERAARLVPAVAGNAIHPVAQPPMQRPLRLLPAPERVAITAEVPDGLPALMVWRGETYRLLKGQGPERLGGEWWRQQMRLKLVEPEELPQAEPGKPQRLPPYVPDLPLYAPEAVARDYFMVEDQAGRRFWVFRQGLYGSGGEKRWFLHGFFP